MKNVYITGVGSYLPNQPVSNDEMESFLGKIHGISSRLGKAVLRKNGIKTRHYAYSSPGNPSHTNAELASLALQSALNNAQLNSNELGFLATSTTMGDLVVPGLASQVQQQLKCPPLEIASFQSVCAGVVMALKNAYAQVRSGLHNTAAVSGSEFSSKWFQPGFYESFVAKKDAAKAPMDLEFLRWTLSDGAGAVILEDKPHANQLSFKLEWIELKSYADRFDPCMYAGSASNGEVISWGNYSSPEIAYKAGALALKQDFELLYEMFPVWAAFYVEVLNKQQLDVEQIRYFLPHYSAESLGNEMEKLLEKSGAMIPREKWFNNLTRVGNTGSASIFIMLEELARTQSINHNDKILCFVPESGQCTASFFLLTAIKEN